MLRFLQSLSVVTIDGVGCRNLPGSIVLQGGCHRYRFDVCYVDMVMHGLCSHPWKVSRKLLPSPPQSHYTKVHHVWFDCTLPGKYK